MALRESVVLGRYPMSDAVGLEQVVIVFWLPVTQGEEEPAPNFVSRIKGTAFDATPQGPAPSAEEAAALKAGQIVERVVTLVIPDNYSQANIIAFVNACRARMAAVFVSAGRNYGAYQDSLGAWHNRP